MSAALAVRNTMEPAAEASKEEVNDIKMADTEVLLGTAEDIVGSQAHNSDIFDPFLEAKIPTFDMKELTLGRVLGRGGFCVVQEIEKIRPLDMIKGKSREASISSNTSKRSFLTRMMKSKSSKSKSFNKKRQGRKGFDKDDRGSEISSVDGLSVVSDTAGMVDLNFSRDFVAVRANKARRKGGGYVVKQLAKDLYQTDKIRFLKGTVDLAMEAKFLAVLSHPNIIHLAGVSSCGAFNEASFIVLEKMTGTLTQRFKTWMHQTRLTQGVTGLLIGGKNKVEDLYAERLEAAYDIADATNYLHQKNIVFRDLKPDNIGFDRNNTLKLFDFGLAKELLECDRAQDDLYHLTSMTGALRYMAPEVGLRKPYNCKADVYSWSMILWFILSLEPPFGLYTQKMLFDRVLKKGTRPAIFRSWPESIGSLMKRAWDTDIALRPSFAEIMIVLRQEMIQADSTVSGSIAGSVSGDTSLHGIPE